MPFAFSPAGNTRFSVGPASATCMALPSIGRNVRVANVGPSDCYVKFTSSFTSTTTNAFVVLARTVELFDRQANGFVTAQGASGSTLLDITAGEGGA